jgi:HSP20 family protein
MHDGISGRGVTRFWRFPQMAIARWNPWAELFDLTTQVDQLFTTRQSNGNPAFRSLPVDIRQTDTEFVIDASAPGFAPDEVEVTVDGDVLTIRGRHSVETDDAGDQYVRRERRRSSVYRRIGLPTEARVDEISATFDNGVLHVTVPRAQKAQPRRIPVTPRFSGEQPSVAEEQTPAQS